MIFIIIAIMAIVFLFLWACIDIVPQAEARVIERLGVFRAVWGAGIHVKIPVIDQAVVPHIDLREQVLELTNESRTYGAAWGNAGIDAKYNSRFSSPVSFKAKKWSFTTPGFAYKDSFADSLSSLVVEPGNGNGNVLVKDFTTGNSKGHGSYTANGFAAGGYSSLSDFRDVITKDNVRMNVDAAVFYQVTDPKLYAYGMKQPLFALQKLAITTLRNIIGTLELDEVLSSRDFINSSLRATLDEATDSWGLKITRVEIESIVPPAEIQNAMEMQVKAEREKRATILTAEATKQRIILEAEAEQKAAILAAEAEKQKKILEAQGRLKEKELEALGIKALNENCPNDSVIRLKAIQAMEVVSDGNATKIIIPSEMQGLVGLANGLVESAK